jgi:hypothetical protein
MANRSLHNQFGHFSLKWLMSSFVWTFHIVIKHPKLALTASGPVPHDSNLGQLTWTTEGIET